MKSVYHSGELAVQARAGVQEAAGRVGRSIRSTIPSAAQEFLRSQRMVVVGTVDAGGRVWASLLTGEPGFMQAVDERTVRINAGPVAGDPLGDNLLVRDEIGVLAIEFATRRRMRVNGMARTRPEGGIDIHASQVYSNCLKYIQARELVGWGGEPCVAHDIRLTEELTEEQRRWVARADTFFVASVHHEAGVDVSHRGGSAGFVHVVSDALLEWPDYSGNSMFQTLGNLAVNPNAGLLFLDFEGGNTLQMTGRARVIWEAERAVKFAGAERLVEFQIEQVIEIADAIPLRWRFIEYSPFNPG